LKVEVNKWVQEGYKQYYKHLLRKKQLRESNKRIKLLEKELNDLKKQKVFATNNKSYDLCDERKTSIL
jgi:hypothetical protein